MAIQSNLILLQQRENLMNKRAIAFWLFFIVSLFLYYMLLNLVHTYFFPIWFTEPSGLQLLVMFLIIISFVAVPLITAEKFTRFFLGEKQKRLGFDPTYFGKCLSLCVSLNHLSCCSFRYLHGAKSGEPKVWQIIIFSRLRDFFKTYSPAFNVGEKGDCS